MLVKYYDQVCKVIDVRTIKDKDNRDEIQFLIRCKHHFIFSDSPDFHGYNWEGAYYCTPVNVFESIVWVLKNMFFPK